MPAALRQPLRGFGLGALLGECRIDGRGFGGVNLVVVLVRFGQPSLCQQQAAEAVVGAAGRTRRPS